MEEFCEKLKLECMNIDIWYKAYADDIIFILDYDNLEDFLDRLFKISAQYNLKINTKKCGIFLIKNHKEI